MFDAFKQKEEDPKEIRSKDYNFQHTENTLSRNAALEQVDIAQQETKSDLIKWQQELDKDVFKVIMQLRGYSFSETGEWRHYPENAVCNNLFIDRVVIPTFHQMNKNLFNTNFTEDRILMTLKRSCNTLVANMSDGYDKYGIDFVNFNIVLNTIKNPLIASAYRALGGWTKKTDSTNFRRIESAIENPDRAEKRGFSFLAR